jgi:hypothetical protein
MGVNMSVKDLVEKLIKEYGCIINLYEKENIELWCSDYLEMPKSLEEELKRIGAKITAGCAGACSGFGELFREEEGDRVIYYTSVYFDGDYLWVVIEIPRNS